MTGIIILDFDGNLTHLPGGLTCSLPVFEKHLEKSNDFRKDNFKEQLFKDLEKTENKQMHITNSGVLFLERVLALQDIKVFIVSRNFQKYIEALLEFHKISLEKIQIYDCSWFERIYPSDKGGILSQLIKNNLTNNIAKDFKADFVVISDDDRKERTFMKDAAEGFCSPENIYVCEPLNQLEKDKDYTGGAIDWSLALKKIKIHRPSLDAEIGIDKASNSSTQSLFTHNTSIKQEKMDPISEGIKAFFLTHPCINENNFPEFVKLLKIQFKSDKITEIWQTITDKMDKKDIYPEHLEKITEQDMAAWGIPIVIRKNMVKIPTLVSSKKVPSPPYQPNQ